MSAGEFIALSPKCYFSHSMDGRVKQGTKGVPHSVDVRLQNFKDCLFEGKQFQVELQTLTKKNNQMSRVKTMKKGLSRIFVKFPVQKDHITCKPLQENGFFL